MIVGYVVFAVVAVSLVNGQGAPAGDGSPAKMAAGRMNSACMVQPNSTVLDWFAGCLADKDLDYTLPKVFAPCKEFYTGTFDLGSWDGIWEVTCKNMCTDKEKLAECVVDQIKKAVDGKDLMEVSKKACEICEKCVDEIGKKLGKAAPAGAGR